MAANKVKRAKPKRRNITAKKNTFAKKNTKKSSFSHIHIPIPYIIGILMLIGFILRIFNVGVLSFWVDEYVHVDVAKNIAETGGIGNVQIHGLILTSIIALFFSIFEINEFWARLPSVLFGTASISLIYLLGKKLFNKQIGLISAVLGTLSLYLVFWSRLARNYAIFEFTFLALLVVFLYAFEENKPIDKANKFWQKNNLNLKYLALLPIAFFISLITHQSTFFFGFTFLTYCTLVALVQIFIKENKDKKLNFKLNKYSVFAIPTIIGGILFAIFPSFFSTQTINVLEIFLNDFASRLFPSSEYLANEWNTNRFKIFNLYSDIIKYDFGMLYFLGLAGFIASFFINWKSAIFLISSFVVPFLLMSFIFRDPAVPRYLVYIYPIFLISIAAFLYFLTDLIQRNIPKNLSHWSWVFKIIPFIIILPFVRYTELSDLLKVKKKNGFVVDKKLSHWSFTNWKEPCNYVKINKKQGDIILSTVPSATNYYTGEQDNIQFRQKYLDGATMQYVNYDESYTSNRSGHTLNGLAKTISENPRGWLIADYYFDNVYTDPKARQIVFQNMDLHFDASSDGNVRVFSWDHSRPRVSNQDMVEVVGKSYNKMASQELKFNYTKNNQATQNLIVQTRAQAVSRQEAYFVLNKKYKYYLPANKTNGIEVLPVGVTLDKLQNGENTIQYGYNPNVQGDNRKGYAIHQVRFANQ